MSNLEMNDQQIRNRLLPMRIIWLALLLGQLVFLGIVAAILSTGAPVGPIRSSTRSC